MAIALVGTGTTAQSLTINKPTGAASGNILVVAGQTQTTKISLSGWTEIAATNISGSIFETMLYRICDGSEGSSFTFAGGTAPELGMICLSGEKSAAPIDGTPTTVLAASNNVATIPGITTAAANGWLVTAMFSYPASAPTVTDLAISGGTERLQDISGTGMSVAMATESLGAAGATGTRTATVTLSAGTVHTVGLAIVVAEQPAGGGASSEETDLRRQARLR